MIDIVARSIALLVIVTVVFLVLFMGMLSTDNGAAIEGLVVTYVAFAVAFLYAYVIIKPNIVAGIYGKIFRQPSNGKAAFAASRLIPYGVPSLAVIGAILILL